MCDQHHYGIEVFMQNFPSFSSLHSRRSSPFSLGILGVLCLAIVFLAACSDRKGKGSTAPPAPVVVITATAQTIPLTITAVGNVSASSSVAVKSRVMGELMNVHFTEGQEVAQGQLLFTIDKRPFEASLREAEARLNRDRAQLVKAQDDLKRFERLVSGGYTSREQYEQAQTDVATLKATVQADQAAVESAALQLAYCSITAPVAGRAGAVYMDQGNIIKANDEKQLVNIDTMEPVYVVFAVPEMYLPVILAQQKVQPLPVTATPKGGENVQGVLSLIDNTVDIRTGTIRLRATFPNTSRTLWPGQFVSVALEQGERENAIFIPLRCVLNGPTGTYVYTVTPDNKAAVQPVVLGPEYNDGFIVESGLKSGDRVVADGQVRLAPGLAVKIVE